MAWFDDLNLPGATIDGYFGFIHADGPDDDDYPDVALANGWVTFKATTPAARVDGAWLGIEEVRAQIFEGQIIMSEEDSRPVRLLATDAPIGVADWAWTATFDLGGFALAPLTFKAPRDTTVNLTADLIPIKSQPYQIIEGASIVDTEVDTAGERMRFKMSDGTFTKWVSVPNGEPGAKGDKGDKGDPGADGQSPTIAMGAVSTGTTADAWMTGTPLARELNLTLPRGIKGDKGDTPTWGDLPGKPSSFPSTVADVQGLGARLAALEQDTGFRNVSSFLGAGWSGRVIAARVRNRVTYILDGVSCTEGASANVLSPVTGFALLSSDPSQYGFVGTYAGTNPRPSEVYRISFSQYGSAMRVPAGVQVFGNVTVETTRAFPTVLPGTPA